MDSNAFGRIMVRSGGIELGTVLNIGTLLIPTTMHSPAGERLYNFGITVAGVGV